MKSKFLPLVKVKEQKVEEVSSKIAEVNRQIALQHEKIAGHKTEFLSRETPNEGSIHIFAQRQLLNVAFKQELNQLENRLNHLQSMVRDLQDELKNERVELEKFSVLHQDEVQKRLKRIKKKEEEFLDEMGTVRFTNNREIS